jgi:hypothetical protein
VKYSNGQPVDTLVIYKELAYSEEYDSYVEEGEILPEETLKKIASRGRGSFITDLDDPSDIFKGFITALNKTYSPRFIFMIIAICLFLLDIAVRKFKFKWPHEIIRDIKNKKNSK